jgi:hypothetical protein
MKGNNTTNRILHHDTAAQTIKEPPRVSLLGLGIPDYWRPWVFSKRKLFLMQNSMKDSLSDHIKHKFPVV